MDTKRKGGYMMQSSLAERLRVLRAQRGLQLVDAAAKIGVDRHTLRRLERGVGEPRYPTLNKIANAYDVPVKELLEEPVPLGKAPKAGHLEEDRIDTLESFRASILALVEKLSGQFTELQGAGDRGALLTLFTEVAWTGLGIISTFEDADVMQEFAGESGGERHARERVRRALARLEDLSEDIGATVDALEEKPAVVAHLAAHRRRKKAS